VYMKTQVPAPGSLVRWFEVCACVVTGHDYSDFGWIVWGMCVITDEAQ
jgi:hypothetical protein